MNKQRVFTKDRTMAIKGFAICAMLFHHCFFTAEIYDGFLVNFSPFSETLVKNIALFGKLCVGTFAFLSGYGLSMKWHECRNGEKKGYFLKRYIGTMSGYWFAFIVCCVFCQIMNGATLKTYWTGSFLENVFDLLMSILGVSRLVGTPMLIYEWWYMGAAVLFILFVPIFYEAIGLLGSAAVITLTVLLPRMLGVAFLGGTQPLSFLMSALLGVVFERKQFFDKIHCWVETGRLWSRIGKALLSLPALFLAYKLYRMLPFEQYWEIKYGVVPMIVIVCLNETVLNISVFSKILGFLGKHSMNMYLIHMLFITYFKTLLFDNRHFLVSWCMLMLLSLGTSIVFEWVKKLVQWNRIVSCTYRITKLE